MNKTLQRRLTSATMALSIFFGNAALAETNEAITNEQLGVMLSVNHGFLKPPECLNDGVPVEYYATTAEDLWTNLNQSYGAVTVRLTNDEVYIAIDTQLFPRLPQIVQDQIYKHECAHIKAGHLHPDKPAETQEQHQQEEDEADCISIAEMRKEGLTQEQLNTIILYHRGLGYGFRLPEENINNRSDNFRACFKAAPAP